MFDFLTNSFSTLFSKISAQKVLSQKNIDDLLQQVTDALLQADVPYQVVQDFVADIKTHALGQKVTQSLKPGEQFVTIVHERLLHFLGGHQPIVTFQMPSVIMVMGLQGAGKTTTVAKIADFIDAQSKGKKIRILMASVDYYRPAAIEQLATLAQQMSTAFYRAQATEAVAATREIYTYYKQHGFQYLILDTAGRLHTDDLLLKELREVNSVVQAKYKLLVLDAMTGQESLRVAQAFDQDVGFTHALLTKMDSDTRCGAAFAFKYVLSKSIIGVGTGERVTDFEPFMPDRIAGRILGKGDIQSLLEKAEQKIKKTDKDRIAQNFARGKMSLIDFAAQLEMMGKIGSLGQLASYLPGMPSISPEKLEQAQAEMAAFKVIIGSMTHKERIAPAILDGSRKKRIASGAGVPVAQVNLLLTRFEESQQFAKLFKRFGRFGK